MSASTELAEREGYSHGGHDHHEVDITINGVKMDIRPGHYTVSALKTLGGIPQADELEQVIDGKLTPLSDAGSVTIKGCEVLVSHPKDSGSS